MSGAKFTKGPWFVGNYNNLRSSEQDKYSSICVNVSMTLAHDKKNSEYTANANLIAAAPEMYELLKECKDVLGGTYDVNDWPANGETCCDCMMRDIEKLLAKARGEL